MGRPPGCDKVGVKKGPWTPEEDLILVSYIQEHGPGNWRAVPTNTGMMRCSKSCRLRWTNYLRPGIKRGNFTEREDKLIINLQALLGNGWAAIASYLPERTDNDIKNYWNTHLGKKQADRGGGVAKAPVPKGQWERRLQTDIHTARQALRDALSIEPSQPSAKALAVPALQTPPGSLSTYASTTDNIARLLEGWMRPGGRSKEPESWGSTSSRTSTTHQGTASASGSHSGGGTAGVAAVQTPDGSMETSKLYGAGTGAPPAFSMLESWLLDEGTGHGEAGLMDEVVPLGDPREFY